MKIVFFVLGFLILLLTEIARVYFIMPFPGSQQSETIELAYWIQSYLGVLRLVGSLLIAYPLYSFYKTGTRNVKLGVGALLLVYVAVFYLFNYQFLADQMFLMPRHQVMATAADSKVAAKDLVVGVVVNGEARAYPIEIIGYHHQVRDTVGGKLIMVTYCTVCRTGVVFSPEVEGKAETFRLVGMDHFNAMFEDHRTGSWWRQVSGEAIAGKLKGQQLPLVSSEQMRLSAWIEEHPDTRILQPDPDFGKEYGELSLYDEGKGKGHLTRTDSLSWKDKSWVVGVSIGRYARAYDWSDLLKSRVINDQIASTPIVLAMEQDSASFHAYHRVAGDDTLLFHYNDSTKHMVDVNTNSHWNGAGLCTAGKLKGTQLPVIQAYQEFWHSWKTFHPQTEQYVQKSLFK